MCGRFDFHGEAIDVEDVFGVAAGGVPWPAANYNTAPTRTALVIHGDDGGLQLSPMVFGYPRRGGGFVLNARSETVTRNAMFRQAYGQRRAAVVANGFYEWRLESGKKQPYYFRRRDKRLLAFAALWSPPAGNAPPGFVILTTAPNSLVEAYHDRMPVVLDGDGTRLWLSQHPKDAAARQTLLAPFDPDAMECFAVSRHVNNARNEDAACIVPLAAAKV